MYTNFLSKQEKPRSIDEAVEQLIKNENKINELNNKIDELTSSFENVSQEITKRKSDINSNYAYSFLKAGYMPQALGFHGNIKSSMGVGILTHENLKSINSVKKLDNAYKNAITDNETTLEELRKQLKEIEDYHKILAKIITESINNKIEIKDFTKYMRMSQSFHNIIVRKSSEIIKMLISDNQLCKKCNRRIFVKFDLGSDTYKPMYGSQKENLTFHVKIGNRSYTPSVSFRLGDEERWFLSNCYCDNCLPKRF